MSVDIYPLQQFTTSFTQTAAYESTTFANGAGGATAPITGYPELACGENIKTVAGAGPTGQNTIDKSTGPEADYEITGASFLAFGSLASGQFDVRDTGSGILTIEMQVFLDATVPAAAAFSGQFILVSGGTAASLANGSGGQTRFNDYVVTVGYFRTGGPGTLPVTWYAQWYKPSGATFVTQEIDATAPFTFDDAWHTLKLRVKPSTITGTYSGTGTTGGATAATDGAVEFLIDNVSTVKGTGLQIVVNKLATTQPELYYGRGFWLGDGGFFAGADLIGPTTDLHVYYESATPILPSVPVSTPNAARTPCTPQAVVTNGGKGQAGCNVGGIGGGHQYAGDIGTVPQHPDPDDGEVLTGDVTRSSLEPWIELVHQDYPSEVKTTYRRAFEELADDGDYEGGRKQSGVLLIGEIEHGLGNEQGGFEAGTATLQLSDIRDRLFRDLSADQEIDGDEYRVKLATDQARAAHIAPRILQRGIVQQAALESLLQSRITGVDWLFSDFGPFGPGRQDPNWTFGDLGDAAPSMTNDTKAQAIPLLYGEKSDENATSPTGGSGGSFAKGLLPGYFLGRFDLTGLVTTPPDSTGSTLEQVVAELQASVDAHTTVADWSSIIGVADAMILESMGTVPNSYTGLANVIGYGDLNVLLSMGTTAPPAATEWGFIATGLGPWFQYTGVYGSDLGCGDALQTHDRVKLDPTTRADLLVPGVNWPYANPYLELTNPDTGRTFWLTGVFVTGPLLDDHLNGVVTMAFNAIGIEDVGDGTGLPIMRIEDAKQHRLENHWINQWSSGPYVTDLVYPQFEDGTAMVRSSSFTARQQFFIDQLGDNGILVSEYADTQQSNLDVVRQWNTDTESKIGVNQHGQILDFGFDEFVDTSDWPRLNHVTDIFGPMVRTSGIERENVVSGSCDWDPDFDKTRAGPFIYSSATGIAKYKGRIRQGEPIIAKMLDNTEHFQWVLQRRLERLQVGLTMIDVPVPIDPWLNYDVGTGVLLNSEDGPGPDGYVDQPCLIMRRRISVQSRLMTLTLWDVGDLMNANIRTRTVTLTNAQILDLPITPVEVIPSPASGFRIKLMAASLNLNNTAAAYTNINTTSCVVWLGPDGPAKQTAGSYLVNDNSLTPNLTQVTNWLGANTSLLVDLVVPSLQTISDGAAGKLWVVPNDGNFPGSTASIDWDGKAVKIFADNNGSLSFTAGDAANTLTITTYYALEAVA